MSYYFHSIAIRAGFRDEKDMALQVYKLYPTCEGVGVAIGRHAGVYKIGKERVRKFLLSQGIKLKPGRPKNES